MESDYDAFLELIQVPGLFLFFLPAIRKSITTVCKVLLSFLVSTF